MKRRKFLRGVAATSAVAAAASSFPAPAIAQGVRELKMVTTWPKNLPALGTGAERAARRITALSDGKLRVKVFAAGELVPPSECFDAVSSGTADMYHAFAYYYEGKSPAFNFFTAVPFGLTATERTAWIHWGGGQELWDELAARFNLKPFMVGNTGVQMGGWFRREVNTLDDLKGLKFRMPGLGGEALRRLGVIVISLPGGEVFPALQSGAIDATEWVGPFHDLALGFYKVAKYYYYPGFHEPGAALDLSINLKVWESLGADQQEIIRTVAAAENDLVFAEFNAHNATALETLRTEHGVKLRKFSNEILNAFGKKAGEVVAEAAASDPMTGKVYESFINFRKNAMRWSRFGAQAYWNARLLPFKYG